MNIKNFLYSIASNGTSTLITVIVTLVLPKVISVEDYGLFQYYIMLSGYIGVCHLGWADGLYLQLCGAEYEQLPFAKMQKQLRWFVLLQIFCATCFLVIGILFLETQKRYIVYALTITIVITNLRIFLTYILQATYRIMDASKACMTGNIVYFLVSAICLLTGARDYRYYIGVYIAGIIVTLMMNLFYCAALFRRYAPFRNSVRTEIEQCIRGSVK